MEHPTWFFAWTSERPYITSMCSWTRKQLIDDVERSFGRDWKRIYRQGGRALKCTVIPDRH